MIMTKKLKWTLFTLTMSVVATWTAAPIKNSAKASGDVNCQCWVINDNGCPVTCAVGDGGTFFINGHFVPLDQVWISSTNTHWYAACQTGDGTQACDNTQDTYLCNDIVIYASAEDCANEVNSISSGVGDFISGPVIASDQENECDLPGGDGGA
jgi:hypothetical protein